MSTYVVTRSACDGCGALAEEPGPHGDCPPKGWGMVTLTWRGDGVVHGVLCPGCAAAVERIMRRAQREGGRG